jgi:hypothetical protein
MIYFTYNDLPSGIYSSQVIDVCRFIRNEQKQKIRLLALISIRDFFKNKRIIKRQLPDAIVFPMFPKHKNWKWNVVLVYLILLFAGKQAVICRGIFTTNMALKLRSMNRITRVIFDGRGAYKAEFEEYLARVVNISDNVSELEKQAVVNSDFRIAVSQKLVEFWKNEYGYDSHDHVVIPCTLSSGPVAMSSRVADLKAKLNYTESDVLLVYSGSTADWQSIEYVDTFLFKHLAGNRDLKVILLSKFRIEELRSFQQFPSRIIQKWLSVDEVKDYLSISDYGILIREYSVTNKVASPTKFAEYLNAGLKVIISPEIGDFSAMVDKYNLGYVYHENNDMLDLKKVSNPEKNRMCEFANVNYTKINYIKEYRQILKSDAV